MLRKDWAKVVYEDYCPRHEFDTWECCACCAARKREMWRLDNQLRVHFWKQGLKFGARAA